MKKIETYFDKSGKVKTWENFNEYKTLIDSLPDGRYINIIEKVENIRSKEQNNAIWAIPYRYFEQALTNAGIFKDVSAQGLRGLLVQSTPPVIRH